MDSSAKIRVLVCDDSAVIRRMVVQILAPLPELDLVGFASDGRFADEMIRSMKPHVVVLDIMMPELDGLDVLAMARARDPLLPVILFTQLSFDTVSAGLEALSSGATEYVLKPSAVGPPIVTLETVQDELREKVVSLGRVALAREMLTLEGGAETKSERRLAVPRSLPQRYDIIAIATSTGGPAALTSVVSRLPADFPVPIVIVQHMPPLFTTYLAASLDRLSPLRVREATAGAKLCAGEVWLAPGDFHMEVEREGAHVILATHQGPRESCCRPAADPLLRSVAKAYGSSAAAVVLTGMGKDGLLGCLTLARAGGQIIAQNEESSVVWGMPGAVVEAALATQILPLDAIPAAIERLAWRGRARTSDGDRAR